MRKMTSVDEENRALELVESKIRRLEERIKRVRTIVALLGAGGNGLDKRRSLAKELREKSINTIIPEEVFPRDSSPSVVEREVLSSDEIDLVFVNVESWGSVSEFVQFHSDSKIAPKLRVMVARQHHPLYGSSKGYLTDTYFTHDAVFGHVYMYHENDDGAPSPNELVLKLAERFRQWKAFKSK